VGEHRDVGNAIMFIWTAGNGGGSSIVSSFSNKYQLKIMLPLYLLGPTCPPTPGGREFGPPWIFGPRVNPDLYGAWHTKTKVPFLSTQLLHYKWIINIKISPETILVPCNSHTKSSEQGPTQLSKFVFHIDFMMSKLSTQVHDLNTLINPNKISHSY
jgi:hypothetical protein